MGKLLDKEYLISLCVITTVWHTHYSLHTDLAHSKLNWDYFINSVLQLLCIPVLDHIE